MTNSYLMPYIMCENESAHKAYYYLSIFSMYKIVLVVDKEKRLIGIITPKDFNWQRVGRLGYDYMDDKSVANVCNRNFQKIFDNDRKYADAALIFASYPGLNDIPVIDEDGIPTGIISKWQLFFKDYLANGKLCRNWYTEAILMAANLAKEKDYKRISNIEFGVAAGTGLVCAEEYAEACARLTGIEFELYGFDSGLGLPDVTECVDMVLWKKGFYPMDIDTLQARLKNAKMVIGDIKNTTCTFFEEYNPAPIGCMLIDVDLYASTIPVLDMLLEKDDYFLPVVQMYFVDIAYDSDYEGEYFAVKGFNAKSENIKIYPEDYVQRPDWKHFWRNNLIKRAHRFSHPKYQRSSDKQLFLNLEA